MRSLSKSRLLWELPLQFLPLPRNLRLFPYGNLYSFHSSLTGSPLSPCIPVCTGVSKYGALSPLPGRKWWLKFTSHSSTPCWWRKQGLLWKVSKSYLKPRCVRVGINWCSWFGLSVLGCFVFRAVKPPYLCLKSNPDFFNTWGKSQRPRLKGPKIRVPKWLLEGHRPCGALGQDRGVALPVLFSCDSFWLLPF